MEKKPKTKVKEKKQYVQTEARKKAFERALQIRKQKVEERKKLKQLEQDKINKLKEQHDSKKKKKIEKLKKEVEEITDDETELEEYFSQFLE